MNIMEHKKYGEWLEGLKADDEVVIVGGGQWAADALAIVSRTTKTQVIVSTLGGTRERRFLKGRGREVGVEYGPKIEPATDAARSKVAAAKNRSRLSDLTFRGVDKLTDAEVAAMLEAYDRVQAQKKEPQA